MTNLAKSTIKDNNSVDDACIRGGSAKYLAHDIISQGWPVFPCDHDPESKKPLIANGLRGAFKSTRLVEEWWKRHPDAMVGVPTGGATGVFVLDIDIPGQVHGDDDGRIWFAEMEAEHGALPETRSVKTASGGRHLYFQHVEGVRNRRIAKGVDVRGQGGYVIAPGSVTETGEFYEWENPEAPIADAPRWLLDCILPREPQAAPTPATPYEHTRGDNTAYVEGAVEAEMRELASTPQGSRGYQLNASAFSMGQLVASGVLSRSEAERRLMEAAAANGVLAADGEREVQAKIRRGLEAGLKRPREIPERIDPHDDGTPPINVTRLFANGLKKGESKTAPPAANDDDPLPIVNPAEWQGKEVPARQWFIDGLVPDRQVTLTSGDGGVGKSLFWLQLAAASALSCETMGMRPAAGRVVYLGAEDEAEEFPRRLRDIAHAHHRQFEDLDSFRLIALADRDALLTMPDTKTGAMRPTALWHRVRAFIMEFRPRLIVLDTAADLFGGDEVKRSQVRQFVSMLRALAIEIDGAVVLLSHPSVSGMQSGTGLSGSTAWGNSVRSRLYLTKPKGDDADDAQRVLETMKNNYGKTGDKLKLRWQEGVFVVDDGTASPERGLLQKQHEKVFFKLLAAANLQGETWSPAKGRNYAPKMMTEKPGSEGIKQKQFEGAMHRLMDAGRIRVEMDGSPSRQRKSLIVVQE
ncbi:bifunctional DNA primase/polymerase [Jiella sp. M17.18]|uniref:bifunctional DNA primase/polymerase n=1 Tax=Jiella sp. M17.18 TaxID=3234247 RepID=UPI0034DE56C0